MKALKLIGILILILAAGVATAQSSKRWQRDPAVYLPKALLVQLRSEKRKIDYFEKAGSHAEAEQVRKDVQGVNNAMIKDFKDHFKFCPYYFFVDTNIDMVKAGKFEGILLDGNMQAAANPVVKGNSKDYFIVYFGIPEREKTGKDGEMASRTMYGAGLVVTDYNYIQLNKPALFYYYNNRGYYHLHGTGDGYYYSSKKYSIEYYPLAAKMFEDFKDFFR